MRQCGFIAAIEMVADRKTKTPYPWEDRIGVQACRIAKERGLLIRPLANTLVLMPPFAVTESEIQHMLNILYDAIRAVTERTSS